MPEYKLHLKLLKVLLKIFPWHPEHSKPWLVSMALGARIGSALLIGLQLVDPTSVFCNLLISFMFRRAALIATQAQLSSRGSG